MVTDSTKVMRGIITPVFYGDQNFYGHPSRKGPSNHFFDPYNFNGVKSSFSQRQCQLLHVSHFIFCYKSICMKYKRYINKDIFSRFCHILVDSFNELLLLNLIVIKADLSDRSINNLVV